MSRRAPLDYEINNLLTNNSYSFSRVFKDLPLFVSLCTVLGFGLFMLYSASGQSIGMVSRQLIYMLHRLKNLKNINIIDIVEVNPKKDINNMTSKLAAKILVELNVTN